MSLEFRTLFEIQLGQTFMDSNYVTSNVTRLRCEVLCMHVVRKIVWGHRLNVAFKKDEHLIVLSRQYITFNASIYQYYNDFIAKSEKISRTDDLKLVLQQTKKSDTCFLYIYLFDHKKSFNGENISGHAPFTSACHF